MHPSPSPNLGAIERLRMPNIVNTAKTNNVLFIAISKVTLEAIANAAAKPAWRGLLLKRPSINLPAVILREILSELDPPRVFVNRERCFHILFQLSLKLSTRCEAL